MHRAVLILFLLFAVSPAALAAPTPGAAVHRGHLSLAWDAHDSGLCDEALDYLAEIPADSPLAPRAAWLRAECWYDLGRYDRAAEALLAPEARAVDGRREFLLDIYWDQAWEATGREAYREAAAVLAAADRLLPGDPELAVLATATRYRSQIAAALAGPGSAADPVQRLPAGATPAGGEWLQAYPWDGGGRWVPQTTAEEWMPSVTADAERRALWLRVSAETLGRALAGGAAAEGLELRPETWGWSVGRAGRWVAVEREEWRLRAAVEGLGEEGAAREALRRAAVALADREALAAWVDHQPGPLLHTPAAEGVELRHPETGRIFTLELQDWAPWFRDDPEAWEGFWRDLSTELGRAPRPYRCFCGRAVVLREVLTAEPGELLVVAREGEVAAVVAALCPEHLRYVDAALLREWSVSAEALAARVRADARDNPWQLGFGRGEVGGVPYLFLEGDGASSLARDPALLLGALERADGYGVRGTAVRVYAATGSTLVVAGSDVPDAVTRQAATRLLLDRGHDGQSLADTRLEYRTTLRLPRAAQGTFRLTPLE